MKAVCLTGNRPHKIPFSEDSEKGRALKIRMAAEIANLAASGYTTFISGVAPGADTYFAEEVLKKRAELGLKLEAAVPFPEQSKRFTEAQQERYDKILAAADKITVLGQNYTPYCYFVRNRYMVDSSDIVLTVDYGRSGGTAGTIAYAKQHDKQIINLAELSD